MSTGEFAYLLLAIAAFVAGAVVGGRVTVVWKHRGMALFVVALVETALLTAAAAIGIGTRVPVGGWELYSLIGLMALAMGARNAVVRWLAVPDLTTTVLTLTLTGLSADSKAAGGGNPNWRRRIGAVVAIFAGAVVGALLLLHAGLAAPLALARSATLTTRPAGTRASSITGGRR